MKRALPVAAGALLLVLLAAWVEARRPPPVALTPALSGQPEYCLTCHGDLPEISSSHPVETFGCVSCHGGERLALDADLAHSTMRGGRNPSDLRVVEQSCGGAQCHSGGADEQRDHIQRVLTGVQATYAGAITQMRYTFGLQPDLIAQFGVSAIEDLLITTATGLASLASFDPASEGSPAMLDFAQNCLNCHLGAEPLPGAEYARFTGCAACHTPIPEDERAGFQINVRADQRVGLLPANPPLSATGTDKRGSQIHRLTTAIPYTQCNACHNRGNYSLRDLQFHPRTDAPADRLGDYYQPIAQFTKCEYELDCVDCHTSGEAMGDGDLHSSKKEIQYVQCRTCHGTLTEPPLTRTITSEGDLALRLAFLNPVVDLKVGGTIVVTDRGEPLWNLRQIADGSLEMVGKVTGTKYAVPLVQGSQCPQKPDEQESKYCHACHAVER